MKFKTHKRDVENMTHKKNEPPEKKEAQKDPKDIKIEQLEAKINELTDLLQRLQAEFENYKKRADKEKQEFCKLANAELVIKILPILDSFEMALKNIETTSKECSDAQPEFVSGVKLIYSQLYDTLEKAGLKRIEALGKKFDPYSHEVLLQQESDKDDFTILEELQKGYMFNGRLIRTSKVKIGRKVQKNCEKV